MGINTLLTEWQLYCERGEWQADMSEDGKAVTQKKIDAITAKAEKKVSQEARIEDRREEIEEVIKNFEARQETERKTQLDREIAQLTQPERRPIR